MNCLKRVKIATCLLHSILSHGTREARIYSDPLPEDAVLVAVHSDGRTVTLTYQSDSFEDVPDGEEIPELCPMFHGVSVSQ